MIAPRRQPGGAIAGDRAHYAADLGSNAVALVGVAAAILASFVYVVAQIYGVGVITSRFVSLQFEIGVFVGLAGILVFDLPNLPVQGGQDVRVFDNDVVENDTPNFAPKGNIVAGVPRGTGIMVMANEGVWITQNRMADNPTAHVLIVAYPQPFTDKSYNPLPRSVVIEENSYVGGGEEPQMPGGAQLVQMLGGRLPPVVWDGVGPNQPIVPL